MGIAYGNAVVTITQGADDYQRTLAMFQQAMDELGEKLMAEYRRKQEPFSKRIERQFRERRQAAKAKKQQTIKAE